MEAVYGYEHYQRAQDYFADEAYLDAARELEELFTDLAELSEDDDTSTRDVAGHGLSEARLLLARAYYHSAQLGRAERAARDVIAEDPQDAYAHLLLGRTLTRAGRADEARGPLRLAELLGGYES
ncbi:tetratricopeptide repeat protein [Marihabitans asiaticum]|nr:tetratricopeptide repeat protein [Marihabitans asiaticum]